MEVDHLCGGTSNESNDDKIWVCPMGYTPVYHDNSMGKHGYTDENPWDSDAIQGTQFPKNLLLSSLHHQHAKRRAALRGLGLSRLVLSSHDSCG